MIPSYPSNLTYEQWELLSGLIPSAKKGGRKRSVDMRAFAKRLRRRIVNAILYILCAGCAWRMLPNDFPKWKTVGCVNVVTRHEEHKGFVVLPKRWLVERTFGWFNWCRRLSKDYEVLPPDYRDVYLYRYDSFNVKTTCVIKITMSHVLQTFLQLVLVLTIFHTNLQTIMLAMLLQCLEAQVD